MKLFVHDHNGNKRYLNAIVGSRNELVTKLGGEYFLIENATYHVSQVNAEKTNESMVASTVIGGALGLFGGMPGVIIGGALGALFGNEADKKEVSQIEAFNRS